MKKVLIIGLLLAGLVACGISNPPYTQRLSQNVRTVSAADILDVTAEDSYPVPMEFQPLVVEKARFKTIYDLYEEDEDKILIPSGIAVTGIYINDGMQCRIVWASVYAHNDKNEDSHNAVPIYHATVPTQCDPATGIQYGDRLTINFTDQQQ